MLIWSKAPVTSHLRGLDLFCNGAPNQVHLPSKGTHPTLVPLRTAITPRSLGVSSCQCPHCRIPKFSLRLPALILLLSSSPPYRNCASSVQRSDPSSSNNPTAFPILLSGIPSYHRQPSPTLPKGCLGPQAVPFLWLAHQV